MKPEHLKKRCQKHVIFGHRLFRVPASILEGLEPPSWRQIGRLGTPGRSQKSPKSNILGTCVRDACKKIQESKLEEVVITDSITYRCPEDITKIRQVSVDKLIGEAIRRVSNEESVSTLFA